MTVLANVSGGREKRSSPEEGSRSWSADFEGGDDGASHIEPVGVVLTGCIDDHDGSVGVVNPKDLVLETPVQVVVERGTRPEHWETSALVGIDDVELSAMNRPNEHTGEASDRRGSVNRSRKGNCLAVKSGAARWTLSDG